MWRRVVLISVYYLSLVMAQGLLDYFHLNSYHHTACGLNEYFERCTHNCPPEATCESRKIGIVCLVIGTPCIPKCICKEGYYRKIIGGDCISEKECGPACGEGEEYKDCTNPCIDESCDAMGSLKLNCTSPEPCVPGCACKEGFYKLFNTLCVPKCYCSLPRALPDCRN